MTNDPTTGAARPRFIPRDAIGLGLRGFFMGAADIIPGVSGGTIALVTGIYERFIDALRSLSPAFVLSALRGRPREAWSEFARMHWGTLIPLGAGIGLAIVAMSKVITWLMDEHPGPTYAFFFGLILASAFAPFARMKTRSWRHGVAAAIAAALALVFVLQRPGGPPLEVARDDAPGQAITVAYAGKVRKAQDFGAVVAAAPGATEYLVYDEDRLWDEVGPTMPGPAVRAFHTEEEFGAAVESAGEVRVLRPARAPLLWILVCGALAISAMILPGVSGSFLLLFLGQYYAVLAAIHGVIDLIPLALGRDPDYLTALAGRPWWSDVVFLGVFGVGVLCGMAAFSRVVSLLLHRSHDVTMAALTGVMLGALAFPARETLEAGEGQGASFWGLCVGVALVGAVLVAGLTLVERAGARRARVME